ncbi:RNA polymerase sigma factor [Flavobacterium sp. RSB2_4_14]|uniref:RNA polymerase sigma factor n=1 Tax=Flavobacterium sp. RSB2_4_14 TaxID=3447665 RepID=UPI003F3F6F66
MEIKQLINDCKNNNRKAQEQLYRLYAPKLFAVCLKYSRSYSEAQDHLQDGFLIIFDKIGQFSFKGSFDGWLKRIMINNVLQQYRSETFLSLVKEEIPEEIEIEIDDENISLDYLLKIIQELPDRYRLVFNLYVLDGYSHQEIAEMLNVNIGTSKSNLARAKMILREKIEHYKNEENKIFPSAK